MSFDRVVIRDKVHVGNSAGYFDDSMNGAGREVEFFGGGCENFLCGGFENTVVEEFLDCEI